MHAAVFIRIVRLIFAGVFLAAMGGTAFAQSSKLFAPVVPPGAVPRIGAHSPEAA